LRVIQSLYGRQSKLKVFFILDKWCHANKKFGTSAWESNFVTSFSSLNEHEFSVFHFDEFRDLNPGISANPSLVKCIKNETPDFIFLVIYEEPSYQDKIISLQSLAYIRDNLKIPIVTIFGDLEHAAQVKILNILEPFVSLILFTALAPPGIRIKNQKLKYSWVPKNPQVFYAMDGIVKSRDVSYFGTPKPDRLRVVKYLAKNSAINVSVGGGERQENIPVQEYASLIRQSKICLSFSRAANCHVTNARVFEVISCNSMLLEQAGMETPKILVPYTDYVPFFSKADCLDKAIYFLRNEIEREEIAKNAHSKYLNFYTARRFWDEIFEFALANKVSPKTIANENLQNKPNLSGNSFWGQSILKRSIPEFDESQYTKFPIAYRISYPILNQFMVSGPLYLLFRLWWKCIEFIRRVIRKIYRVIFK